jgi:hypothetical protein
MVELSTSMHELCFMIKVCENDLPAVSGQMISLPGPPFGHYPPRREEKRLKSLSFFLQTHIDVLQNYSRMMLACIPEYVTENILRVSRLYPSFVYLRPLIPLLQSFGHR